MKNYIAFNIGDIVCVKPKYYTPLGEMETDTLYIRPFIVEGFVPDKHFARRDGEVGNSNEYRLSGLWNDISCRHYQYELILWNDLKEEVLKKLNEYVEFIKGV